MIPYHFIYLVSTVDNIQPIGKMKVVFTVELVTSLFLATNLAELSLKDHLIGLEMGSSGIVGQWSKSIKLRSNQLSIFRWDDVSLDFLISLEKSLIRINKWWFIKDIERFELFQPFHIFCCIWGVMERINTNKSRFITRECETINIPQAAFPHITLLVSISTTVNIGFTRLIFKVQILKRDFKGSRCFWFQNMRL